MLKIFKVSGFYSCPSTSLRRAFDKLISNVIYPLPFVLSLSKDFNQRYLEDCLGKYLQRSNKITLCRQFTLILSAYFFCVPLHATPNQDQAAFRKHYQERFPQLKLNDYANGVYAIDAIAKQSWLAIEEFPPYETAIEAGKKLFNTPFANGKHYADCLPNQGIGIAYRYPQWDKTKGEAITLAKALNDCRINQQEPALAYEKADMVYLLAYLAYTTRGKAITITIPKDDPRAFAAYEQGKAFYYQRHGQLNFSCATCHIQNTGKKLRAEILSASLGHTNNWPTYRLKWGEIGSLHRRFAECLTNIKAQAYPEQSPEFRNLEYFLGYMGNGVPISGPSTRK